jgi:hypothetical protein
MREAGRLEQFRLIMADLGYLGIQRSGMRTLLPFKRAPGQHLAAEQEQPNADLSANRILIENFFGRWKSLFGIVHGTYRGDLKYLRQIIPSTVSMTNWYIAKHPLCRVAQAVLEAAGGENDQGPATPL